MNECSNPKCKHGPDDSCANPLHRPDASITSGELLPCPFCGNADFSEGFVDENENVGGCYTPWYRVICRECGTFSEGARDDKDAIAKWNRRPAVFGSASQQNDLVQSLDDILAADYSDGSAHFKSGFATAIDRLQFLLDGTDATQRKPAALSAPALEPETVPITHELVLALQRSAQGYRNLIELKLLPPQYFPDAERYATDIDELLARARRAGAFEAGGQHDGR